MRRLPVAAAGVLCFMASLRPGPLAGQENRALRILSAAADRYAGVKSLCADFEQRLQVPMLDEDRTGKGRLCQDQPNLFAMRFTDPKGDAVVADGTSVWIYYPSSDPKQVIRMRMTRSDQGFDFHREFLQDPADKYTASYVGTDTVAGHVCRHLHLVPKQRTSYRSADVWIDAGVPVLRRVRVDEENGSLRTVTLLHVRTNLHIDPSWFTFVPPRGAEVIRR